MNALMSKRLLLSIFSIILLFSHLNLRASSEDIYISDEMAIELLGYSMWEAVSRLTGPLDEAEIDAIGYSLWEELSSPCPSPSSSRASSPISANSINTQRIRSFIPTIPTLPTENLARETMDTAYHGNSGVVIVEIDASEEKNNDELEQEIAGSDEAEQEVESNEGFSPVDSAANSRSATPIESSFRSESPVSSSSEEEENWRTSVVPGTNLPGYRETKSQRGRGALRIRSIRSQRNFAPQNQKRHKKCRFVHSPKGCFKGSRCDFQH